MYRWYMTYQLRMLLLEHTKTKARNLPRANLVVFFDCTGLTLVLPFSRSVFGGDLGVVMVVTGVFERCCLPAVVTWRRGLVGESGVNSDSSSRLLYSGGSVATFAGLFVSHLYTNTIYSFTTQIFQCTVVRRWVIHDKYQSSIRNSDSTIHMNKSSFISYII